MTSGQFERELDFGAMMAVAREMHGAGLISRSEYVKIGTIFRAKYRPVIGVILPKKY